MLPLILLVDDEEDILEYLTWILSKKYSILTTENGKEALHLLNKEAVQLIICDVMMPEMDGFELCRTIKSNFEYCHIPIILLTARNTIQSKVEGLELGADAYIEKPFSKEHLQAQVASLLTNRNMIREYFASSPLVHIKSIAHSKTDERFLETLNETIFKNIGDADLDVDKLAKLMNMSRPTLFRKIKAISNMTPNELITLTRLKKAAELLSDGQYKIFEVSDLIGYNHQSNFTRDFHKQFKMTPSEYMNNKISGQKSN
jgi:DNA-binding response OmpR family regulator